jgi:hypothetical protein
MSMRKNSITAKSMDKAIERRIIGKTTAMKTIFEKVIPGD